MQSTVALIATAHTLILHVLAFGGMSMLQSDRLPPRRLGNRGWLACSSLLFCRHGYSRRLPAAGTVTIEDPAIASATLWTLARDHGM